MGVGAIAAEVLQGSGKVEVIKNGQHAKIPPRGGEGGGLTQKNAGPIYSIYTMQYMYEYICTA